MQPSASRVLGVDLACRSWDDTGTALVEFTHDGWAKCRVGVLQWPDRQVSPVEMASLIDAYARENGVSAVCLDGPQGWRRPGIGPSTRPGVGRLAEYEVRAQGKVGEYGNTYPRNQAPWITFCITVYDQLLACPGVLLANDPDATRFTPPHGGYILAEVYPTSTWRASGLTPLPGKQRTTLGRMLDAERWLATRYGMPTGFVQCRANHDHLQAVVAALPGVGLLGGPVVPEPNGEKADNIQASLNVPAHRVEGLIWDARPAIPGDLPPVDRTPPGPPVPVDGGNPLLPDDRDQTGDDVLSRGARLLSHLIKLAQGGDAAGVGYADFVVAVNGVSDYSEVVGRNYAQSDFGWVVELADQVTDAARGALKVSRGETTIRVGMDSFIWLKKVPHILARRAFADHQQKYGYTPEQWAAVFPEAARRVMSLDEARRAAAG